MMNLDADTEFSPGLVRASPAKRAIRHFPLKNIDRLLLFSTIALAVFGIIMIYSATRADVPSTYFLKRQVMYLLLSLAVMTLAAGFDYRKMMPYSKIFYGVVILLLMLVFLFRASGGAHRWIPLWLFDLQPSELAKLAVIMMLATFAADRRMEIISNREFLQALAIAAVPMFFIFLEPDLGVTLSVLMIFIGMMLVGGARLRQIAVLVVSASALVIGGIELHLLKAYQLTRLLVFVRPDIDPLGAGYNLAQSKIAIGSGQLFGKGLFHGTQTNLKFIPAHHTDFIFSVVGEELGFIGGMLLLALFTILIWRGFKIAASAKDPFGTMLATGIVVMLFFQILLNVGMTMGIMPVTGITLPFMSFGGSSLAVNFLCIGLLLNIGMRRFPQGT
jgi:rod shape determining protein RodA